MLLQRARGSEALPAFELRTEDKALQLRLPQVWLDAHPLTRTDLEQERDYLKHIDIKLQVKTGEKLAA